MVRYYQNVPPRKFIGIFHLPAPCNCYTEEANTSYNVNVVSDDKTSLLKLVIVTCSSCNTSANFDMKSYHILEGDVSLIGAKRTK